MPILREDILNPIAGDNPAGVNLYYDPVMDKLKEARREDDDAPAGDWERELKTADHKTVIKLGSETVATRSKDLQISAWLTESLLKVHSYPGLKEGLDLLRGIVDTFWDGCYPEIEDGDLELRAAPLDWVGARLELPVKQAPLLKNGYNILIYQDSRKIPLEADLDGDENKQKIRSEAVADGKVTPEEWEIADKATPNEFLQAVAASLDGCIESVDALSAISDEKFGDQAPTFGSLKTHLTEVRHTVKLWLKARGITDGPAEADDAAADDPAMAETAGGAAYGGTGGPRGITVTGVIPANKEEVAIRLEAICKYLREQDPANPGPYMMLRGFRWGELRGLGSEPDPRELLAPPTEQRQNVKRAFLNGDWSECLNAAETVMAGPGGRAWLDVHRYAVKAAQELGYDLVANAIKNDLRGLLADLPELPRWQLLDDSPTANTKTREWLEEVQQEQPLAPRVIPDTPPEPPPPPKFSGRDAFEVAKDYYRSGSLSSAISWLNQQLAKESNGRGRFERKAQIAWLLIESTNDVLALSYVEECLAQVEAHKLEEWEAGPWLAEFLASFLSLLERRGADWEVRNKLYKTIARLDPAKALSIAVPS
ncbi:MAG: type VI secretion system protein TssA [Acidobacteria bacterium]|nr:type VI secretion system protein TssA [Acidobacteriota bacterium]